MNDNFEQGSFLRPAALPNLDAIEDEEGTADVEVDGFIVVKVVVLAVALICDPVFNFSDIKNQGFSVKIFDSNFPTKV